MADGGKVIIKIDGDIKDFKNSIDHVKGGLNTLNKGFAIAGAAATVAFGAATKVGMEFESQMSTVSAISGATAKDLQILTDKAEEMGIKSAFSAKQAGQAMEYMAMAGWKTEEMLGGVEGIMNLAAASGEDLANVSDIVTDAMTAFGLSADKSGEFADVLASASSNANTNVGLMGETFKYVAPAAGALGFNIQDTAVAIGLMANAGIKGSQAGTALRSTITRMAKPTKESAVAMDKLGLKITNADGSMKSFNQIMVDMRKGFKGMTADQKASTAAMLGGQEAMSGLLAIANASESDFKKLTAAIDNSAGSAEQMAEVKLDNLQGQITLLGSSMEGLGIAIYDKFGNNFKNVVKDAIQGVNTITTKLTNGELDGALTGIAVSITAIGTAIVGLNVAFVIDDISRALRGEEAATKAVIAVQEIWNLVCSTSPIFLIGTAIAAVTAGLVVLYQTTSKAAEEERAYNRAVAEQTSKINESTESIKSRHQSIVDSTKASLSEIEYVGTLTNELDKLTDANGKVKEGYEGRVSFILGQLNDALGTEYSMTDGVIQKYGELKQSIFDVIEAKKLEILQEAAKEEYASALKERIELQKNANDAYIAASPYLDEYYSKMQAITEAEKIYKDASESARNGDEVAAGQLQNLAVSLDNTKKAYDDFNKKHGEAIQNYIKADEALSNNIETTSGYENAMERASKSTEDGIKAFEDFISNMGEGSGKVKTFSQDCEETIANLGNKVTEALGVYNNALDLYLKNQNTATKAALDEANKNLTSAITDYTNAGGEFSGGLVTGFNTNGELSKIDLNPMLTAISEKETNAKGLGNDFALGYGKGIKEGSNSAVNEAISMAQRALAAIQKTQNSHSPAKKTAFLGDDFDAGFALGIKRKSDIVEDSVRGMTLHAIDTLEETMLDSRTEVQKVMDEMNKTLLDSELKYNKESERLKDSKSETDKKYLERLKDDADKERKIYDALQRDIENSKKNIVSYFKEIAENAFDSIEEVQKAQNDMLNKLKGFKGLYESKVVAIANGQELKVDTLTDQKARKGWMKRYEKLLMSIKDRKGVSSEFFKELRDLSIEDGMKVAEMLAQMDDTAFEQYMKDWQDTEDTAKSISKILFKDEAESVANEVTAAFDKNVADFFGIGEDSAKQFGEGFMNKLNTMMNSFKATISMSLSDIMPDVAYEGGGGNTSNTNIYNFTSTNQTLHEQMLELQAAKLIEFMRGARDDL